MGHCGGKITEYFFLVEDKSNSFCCSVIVLFICFFLSDLSSPKRRLRQRGRAVQKPEVSAAAAAPCELQSAPLPVPLPGQRGVTSAGALDRRGSRRRLWTWYLSVRRLWDIWAYSTGFSFRSINRPSPSICSLSTEREDIRDQESVSRVLAELLDNQECLFDSEDDDVSTTNDYSSINEQVWFFSHCFFLALSIRLNFHLG